MIRILFVDDEAVALQAMRRSLQSMSGEWSMEFAASGAAALEALARNPAHVVVSDMRMPGMDGWQLLTEVRKRHPQTLRIVLSGPADPSCITRCIGTAHQYLAKPFDGATLKAAITQSRTLRQLLSSERVATLSGRLGKLPGMPKMFLEILAGVRQPSSSVADAARIVGDDAGMTAHVMKLANSAFFGTRQPLGTTGRAAAYLGIDTLGALVLGYGALKSGAPSSIPDLRLERLWQHSFETAIAARTVARCEKLSAARSDEAFVAGMLHDFGTLVFITRPPGAGGAPAADVGGMAAEMEAHHDEMGAVLLGSWGFPNAILEAAAFHLAPSQATGSGLSLPVLVHIANRLVHQRRNECSGPFERGVEADLLSKLGLTERWTEWLTTLDSLDFIESAA